MAKHFTWLAALVVLILIIVSIYYVFFGPQQREVVELSGGEKNMVQHGVDFSDGKSVDVIDYEGHYLLVSSLRVGEAHAKHATGPGCPEKHWHAEVELTAVNDGTKHTDPLAGGCGYGTLAERSVMMYFPNELLAE